jgi:small subunit ribosomal protein S21
MAIRIKARSGEGTEQMMRRFKKLCEKEGLTKDIKRKEFYEKPSERRRRAQRKAINRRLKAEMPVVPGGPAEKGARPPRKPE